MSAFFTKRYFIFQFSFFVLFFTSGFSQSVYQIRGKVIDKESKDQIPFATVLLLDPTDSTMVAFVLSKADGRFEISATKERLFLLKISFIGYGSQFLEVKEPGNEDSGDLVVYLIKEDFQLSEVVVQESSPAIIRNDTTTYKVDPYRRDGETTLADVLNNMPNVRVEEGGEVFFKNKKIDKLMLDGDDLIGENYQAAIRSLDPSVLNEIQVIENHQDNRFLAGIEKGNQTVLNLGVKEDKKKGLFGSMGLGLGPRAHNGVGNLFSYGGKIKSYLLLTSNNVGIKRVDRESDFQISQLSNFSKSWGHIPLLRINQYLPFFLKTSYENPNKERLANINFSYRPSSKLSIVSNFNFYRDKNDFQKENFTEVLLDQPFWTSQRDTLVRRQQFFNNRFKLDYEINESTGLKFDQLIVLSDNYLDHRLFFGSGDISESRVQEMSHQQKRWNSVLEVTRKMGKNHALLVGGSIQSEKWRENFNSIELGYPTSEATGIDQITVQRLWQPSLQARWLYSGRTFNLENQLAYRHQEYGFEVEEISPKGSNSFSLVANTTSFFQSYSIEKLRWNIDLSHRLEYQFLNPGIAKGENRLNWQRKASIKFKLGVDHVLNFGGEIEILPLYGIYQTSVPLFLDFRSLVQGSNQAVWNKQVNYFLGHHYSDIFKKKISLNTGIFWIKNPSLWTLNRMELRPERIMMQLGKTTLNESKGMVIKTEKMIYPFRGNIKLDFNLWQSQFEENINLTDRLSNNYTTSIGYGYISSFQKPFNVEVTGYFQKNTLQISQIGGTNSNKFTNSSQKLTVKHKHGKLGSKISLENFGVDGKQFQFFHYRLDFIYSEKFNFYSEGRNLGNTRIFRLSQFTPNQFFQESYSLLGRIVTLGVNWYF